MTLTQEVDMADATVLRLVPPSPDDDPEPPAAPPVAADPRAQAMLIGAGQVLDTAAPLDELAVDGYCDHLNGDELIAMRDTLTEVATHLASVRAAVDAAANRWVWDHGYTPPGARTAKVCEMGGELWKAIQTGSSSSLKKPEKEAIARAAAERAVAFIVKANGGKPGDEFDTQTRLVLSIWLREWLRAFTCEPQSKALAAGLDGQPADGVPWAIDVASYRTPTSSQRQRTITKWTPDAGEEGE